MKVELSKRWNKHFSEAHRGDLIVLHSIVQNYKIYNKNAKKDTGVQVENKRRKVTSLSFLPLLRLKWRPCFPCDCKLNLFLSLPWRESNIAMRPFASLFYTSLVLGCKVFALLVFQIDSLSYSPG